MIMDVASDETLKVSLGEVMDATLDEVLDWGEMIEIGRSIRTIKQEEAEDAAKRNEGQSRMLGY